MIASYENNEISEINMIPFVDIVLVVLVIFMATATFVAQGKIAITLPESSVQNKSSEPIKPFIVTIDKNGFLFFNDESVDEKSLYAALSSNKKQILKAGVILRSDAKASFEHAVRVIDLCKQNDISKFSIQTQEKIQ